MSISQAPQAPRAAGNSAQRVLSADARHKASRSARRRNKKDRQRNGAREPPLSDPCPNALNSGKRQLDAATETETPKPPSKKGRVSSTTQKTPQVEIPTRSHMEEVSLQGQWPEGYHSSDSSSEEESHSVEDDIKESDSAYRGPYSEDDSAGSSSSRDSSIERDLEEREHGFKLPELLPGPFDCTDLVMREYRIVAREESAERARASATSVFVERELSIVSEVPSEVSLAHDSADSASRIGSVEPIVSINMRMPPLEPNLYNQDDMPEQYIDGTWVVVTAPFPPSEDSLSFKLIAKAVSAALEKMEPPDMNGARHVENSAQSWMVALHSVTAAQRLIGTEVCFKNPDGSENIFSFSSFPISNAIGFVTNRTEGITARQIVMELSRILPTKVFVMDEMKYGKTTGPKKRILFEKPPNLRVLELEFGKTVIKFLEEEANGTCYFCLKSHESTECEFACRVNGET
ncbi:hypothetical protein N7520_000068 [Penicillium odoratum]|uniref:uncharacterized protein n=1 Tax=Penicillium odoratum TaxID=1167516 RepID=UPI0025473F07|nr:uncharacterized protein N7520_000068 [Penicillium odoratum]KAJ5776822.1 hypothetical protein N7520_000068 [Penicillium odoratum]